MNFICDYDGAIIPKGKKCPICGKTCEPITKDKLARIRAMIEDMKIERLWTEAERRKAIERLGFVSRFPKRSPPRISVVHNDKDNSVEREEGKRGRGEED